MSILHISNGDSLTERLQDLSFGGILVTWREMLCEGPTSEHINSDDFIENRASYLGSDYEVTNERYQKGFVEELDSIPSVKDIDVAILWFEYDLFCHVNLIAAVSWLRQQGFEGIMQLVSSGRVQGEDGLKGLSELTKGQLLSHYEDRITLKKSDVELAQTLWKVYNSAFPNQFKKYVKQPSSFPYLSNCLSAHMKRFPSTHNGLNLLETHTLNLIHQHTIRSLHQLTGYVLQYQGYYGYGDSQIRKLIKRLKPFIDEGAEVLSLNEKGRKALEKQVNYRDIMKDDSVFGGAKKYDFTYDISERMLTPL